MRRSSKGFVILACSLMGACSGGDDETRVAPSDQMPANMVVVGSRVLAELNAGEVEITFSEVMDDNAGAMISLREVSPVRGTASVIRQLEVERGLTSLETFLALAPKGSEVPIEITRAHEDEARALGRDDTSAVRQVSFDPGALAPKSAQACDDFVLSTSQGAFSIYDRRALDNVSGSRYLQTRPTTRNVTVGVCNESTLAMQAWRSWHPPRPLDPDCWEDPSGGACDATNTDGIYNIAGLQMWAWYNWRRLLPASCQQFICTQEPTYYRVGGNSANGHSYRLRTGELQPVIQ